jgi:arginyl-tRNA--protein-N-Asp/Glu arginylyltransferase
MSDQRISHWPSWPLPVAGSEVTISGKHACGYLPARQATFRAFETGEISGEGYQRLLDAGFRRSGSVIYQPMCAGCRACVPIRVPVDRFRPSKSQRRVKRRNPDVVVQVGVPQPTREKWELYESYQKQWHRKLESESEDVMEYVAFLYRSPVESVEFEYRDRLGRLLGVGIGDLSSGSLSSVYFYFDPREARRSIGTFSALYEIEWARAMKLKYWYAGYWIQGCESMAYKSRFRPCEVLSTDGVWRELAEEAGTEA